MRLLRRIDEHQYTLTSVFEDESKVPPYAILSHTWGEDADEVTYQDLLNDKGEKKAGHDRINFCGEQARQDDLEYFWIDTCCINKDNKAELSHSIGSMFLWYRNAARCYVYLMDVPAPLSDDAEGGHQWEPDFRKSRWFSRGWTLQELIAPRSVEFFSQEKRRLGDKSSLKQLVHEVTAIPQAALQGAPLHHFSVDERLRWKGERKTKLGEDGAYSLSGLFSVRLAPVYGEGVEEAFKRLHGEIRKMQECVQALRSTDPRDDKTRIENTKGGLLRDSYRWILSQSCFQRWQTLPSSPLLWIKGDPGKGKTMLLCGIINELQALGQDTVVSYFFCQDTDSRINSATAVLRGLLYLLVQQQPWLASHIRKRYDDVGNKAMFEDANAWFALTDVFTHVLLDPKLQAMYLIIDGLDECALGLPELLRFVAKQSLISSRVKWLISSRNRPDFEYHLEQADHKMRLSLELNAASVAAAISYFIEEKVRQLAQRNRYDQPTRSAVLAHLKTNANDTFLWVALVCQELESTSQRHALRKLDCFPPGLYPLYTRMMQHLSDSDDAEVCKQILATALLVYKPISIEELTVLVRGLEEFDLKTIQEIIGLCGSYLTLSQGIIYFVHQSAKDFLLEKAADEVFPNTKEEIHHIIFARSLEVMSRDLGRDIYNLTEPGYAIEDVRQPLPDPLASSWYSCIYWIDHLSDSDQVASSTGLIDAFLRSKYLYWLEALSLCKHVPKGVTAMAKLRSALQATETSTMLRELVYDAHRFAMYHRAIIESHPLQVYTSALLFSPAKSIIRNLFGHEEPDWLTIKPAISDTWNACLQTIENHGPNFFGPNSVAFSHDSTLLAVSKSCVNIYDVSSGACLQKLPLKDVNDIAFSSNCWLATAGDDGLINIWDARSGLRLKTLAHSAAVTSVVFSQSQLASASSDSTIKVWDLNSGECLQTFLIHDAKYVSMAYSQGILVSASYATSSINVKIWSCGSGALLRSFREHMFIRDTGIVVTLSSDASQLALGLDHNIKIFEVSSATCLHQLEGHGNNISSVMFSQDSAWLVSASHDSSIRIWDVGSGTCLKIYMAYDSVRSGAISHDAALLASTTHFGDVQIWDAHANSANIHERDLDDNSVNILTFSRNSSMAGSGPDNGTIRVWDCNTGECVQTLEGFEGCILVLLFTNDATKLVVGIQGSIHIRNISGNTASSLLKFDAKLDLQHGALSCDETRLVLFGRSGEVEIWIFSDSSATCLQRFETEENNVDDIALSPDSAMLAIANHDDIALWDLGSGLRRDVFGAQDRGYTHKKGCRLTLPAHTFIPNMIQ